eukprot:5626448-Amphidinium_carterae.1
MSRSMRYSVNIEFIGILFSLFQLTGTPTKMRFQLECASRINLIFRRKEGQRTPSHRYRLLCSPAVCFGNLFTEERRSSHCR